jgi:lactoylglutathione lyase
MNDKTATRITGVYTVGVPVTDQDRALEFYVDTLGLEKRLDTPVEQFGGRWIESRLQAPPSQSRSCRSAMGSPVASRPASG